MKRNKKIYIPVLVIIIVMLTIIFIPKDSYAITMNRTEMQNIVTSTALSYLNNKTLSDYGQTAMDLGNGNYKSTFLWRQFNQSPEMVNRCNYYHIDCSSFAAIVYMYSLGYDFSEYYKNTTTYYFNDFTKYYNKNSITNYQNAYKYHGKGPSTAYYTKLATDVEVTNLETGEEYFNTDNKNSNIVVYHYKPSYNSTEDQTKIKGNLIKILEPGDIIVYRTKNTTISTGETKTTGHAMVYVGNAIDGASTGLIHSTGSDYKPEESPVKIGDDNYSVRYDEISTMNTRLFPKDTSTTKKESVAFTVLRPLNKFCLGDACSITECTSDNCPINTLNKNAKARVELAKLKIDQYTDVTKTYNDNLTQTSYQTSPVEKQTRRTISKYNSVNQGDTIDYRLYLQNNTQISFCGNGGGGYSSESGCENAGYTWKTSSYKKTNFTDLTITATIPEGTQFVDCNYTCTFDETNQKLTWKVSSLSDYITYRYKVKVTGNNQIINEGMKITTSTGNVLKLAPITTKVNPTINGINKDLLMKEIDKYTKLVNKGLIVYSSSASSTNNLKDLDTITDETPMSQSGFVKSIYYNALGINLNDITLPNLKKALFDNVDNDYAIKTDTEIKALTDETSIKLSKMFVKGMYGGEYVRGNENKDRVNYIRLTQSTIDGTLVDRHDLEFGDIIVFGYTSNGTPANTMASYIYLGMDDTGKNPKFARYESDSGITIYDSTSEETNGKTGFQIFKEIYSKDLFVILRPSQLATTINLDYDGASIKGDDRYVAYDKYRNLNKPIKNAYITTYNYGNNATGTTTNDSSANDFDGWYYNNAKVEDDTALKETSNHTLKAKWITTPVDLPIGTKTGYTQEGWYSDSGLTKKVGNPKASYIPTANKTLYAKWTANSCKITTTSNGGTITPSTTAPVYDTEFNIKATKTVKVTGNENGTGATIGSATSKAQTFAGWTSTSGLDTTTAKYGTASGSVATSWTSASTKIGAETTYFKNLTPTTTGTVALVANWTPVAFNLPTITKTGYTCKWNTASDGSGTSYESGANYTPTSTSPSNVTMYAVCTINSYTVNVNVVNGTATPSSKSINYNEIGTFTINPNEGCEIPTVSCTNSQTASINGTTLTTGKITNNATCTVTYAQTYQVIYNSNNGTGTMENSIHQYGISKELSKNTYTKKGYTFEGWSTTKDGKVEYIDQETIRDINLNNNKIVTLYAVWKEITYDIKYDLDGGTASNPNTYNVETETFKLNEPTKEGYKFIGWTGSNGNEKQKEVTIEKGSIGNKDYTAHYEITKYTITYESNENGTITGITSEIIEYQNTPKGSTTISNEGYQLLKWSVNKDVTLKDKTIILKGAPITEEQIKNIIVKEDLIITAYHHKIKYSISYDSGENGTFIGIETEDVPAGETLLGTTITPHKGYVLSHYISDKDVTLEDGTTIKQGDGIKEEELTKIVVTENLKISAVYKKAIYKINYSSNENGEITGQLSEEQEYQNKPLGTTIEPNEKYEFKYWTADKDITLENKTVIKKGNPITSEQLKQIVVEDNITLTANYKKVIHTVYYKSEETINITGILKEDIKDSNSPTGTTVKVQDVNSYTVWKADKDVVLTSGKVIKQGEKITSTELKQIVIKDDLVLTAYTVNDKDIAIPDTGSKKSIIMLTTGFILISVGGYYIYQKNKYFDNNN